MKATHYQCVNCQMPFEIEADYLAHYHSEHHRYNIKRKLIGLQPLSLNEYCLQFDEEKSSKHSAAQEFHCEICSKKFMSAGTYKQHLASKRHNIKRDELKTPGKMMSKSSSASSFEVLGTEKPVQCMFCSAESSPFHLKIEHNFPPFEQECVNIEGLKSHIENKISEFCCVYCNLKFMSKESVRQHMKDLSHCKLDLDNFGEYEQFYLWKIIESEEESEEETNVVKENQEESYFEELNPPTLEDLERQRQNRIQYTNTGAIINGKEVGYRHLKTYYRQYLNRDVKNLREKYMPCIDNGKSEWKTSLCLKEKAPKVCQIVGFR